MQASLWTAQTCTAPQTGAVDPRGGVSLTQTSVVNFPFYIYCKSGIDFFLSFGLFLVLVFPFGLQINKLKTTKKEKKNTETSPCMALDLVAHHIDERGAFLHLNMAHQDCCFYRGTVLYAFSMSLSLSLLGASWLQNTSRLAGSCIITRTGQSAGR